MRHITLPKPGSNSQLQQYVARLHSTLLDRSRPLWKFHVLEGLAPGASGRRRVGLYTQLHHAAVDGQAVALDQTALYPGAHVIGPLL